MTDSFLYNTPAVLLAILLFAGIIIFYIFGFGVTSYLKKRNPEHTTSGITALEGALLGLLSLLLAFTFNKSASNYDTRKALLVQETNDIGTALLRSDLYPDSIRQELRKDFKAYIIARIDYYKAGTDENKIAEALKNAALISTQIWKLAAYISRQSAVENSSIQMIPALNNIIDIVTTREASRKAHVPDSILWLLFLLTLAGSFIVGYANNSKKTDWIILTIYSLMTVMTIYLILDLDRPRSGIINTSAVHQNMDKLLDSFQTAELENK